MKLLKNFLPITLLLCSTLQADVVLVANKKTGLTHASESDVNKLFTGRGNKLGSTTVKPVLQHSGQAHDEFLKNYIKRSSVQLANAWKKLVFTGKASMPENFNSDAEVVSAITEDTKLVGYIDRSSVTEDLIIVEIK